VVPSGYELAKRTTGPVPLTRLPDLAWRVYGCGLAHYSSQEGTVRMELLTVQMMEVDDELETLGAAGEDASNEVYGLATGTRETLSGMYLLLEHIGDVLHPQVSTSGETPLMSP